jgi:hypothetical protein
MLQLMSLARKLEQIQVDLRFKIVDFRRHRAWSIGHGVSADIGQLAAGRLMISDCRL